jgi:hypothetical protein
MRTETPGDEMQSVWVLLLVLLTSCTGKTPSGPTDVSLDGRNLNDGGDNPNDVPEGTPDEGGQEVLHGPLDWSDDEDRQGHLGDLVEVSVDVEAALEDLLVSQDALPESDLPSCPQTGDSDEDGIPDGADPFPCDSERPGTSSAMTVYMHTPGALWKLDLKTYAVSKAGYFKWPDGPYSSEQMTDIAIDRHGVLYGVSFIKAYVCHPTTVECWELGDLPDFFNGLTMIPKGVIDPDREVLVGISVDGGWYRLDVNDNGIAATKLGQYGEGYYSTGDAYSIQDVGTFAAVYRPAELMGPDYLIEVDPLTGSSVSEVGVLPGDEDVLGLAGWTGLAFAFEVGGDIVVIDTSSGEIVEILLETSENWWGAGVRTLIF